MGTAADTARGSRGGAVAAASVASEIGFGGGAVFSSEVLLSTCSGSGVSSTVECFPVVHGGISRNSSKVRTRGLQHFQPIRMNLRSDMGRGYVRLLTLLAFVEHWRTRVVYTILVRVRESLATALVYAFAGHVVYRKLRSRLFEVNCLRCFMIVSTFR